MVHADGARPAGIVFVGIVLALMAGACVSYDSSEPITTVATMATTTTNTSDPCFKFPVLVLRLQNDFREASRGIVAPDRAAYRARAQALVDEAHSLGCPTPVGLTSFLR